MAVALDRRLCRSSPSRIAARAMASRSTGASSSSAKPFGQHRLPEIKFLQDRRVARPKRCCGPAAGARGRRSSAACRRRSRPASYGDTIATSGVATSRLNEGSMRTAPEASSLWASVSLAAHFSCRQESTAAFRIGGGRRAGSRAGRPGVQQHPALQAEGLAGVPHCNPLGAYGRDACRAVNWRRSCKRFEY